MKPKTRYTKSGDCNIAFQVIGEGPTDIVYIPGWVSNIDMMWTEPRLTKFFSELSKFSRLILFDKRGTGLSDRVNHISSLEERMDDIRAVMDEVGSTSAVIFGHSEGGSVSALFAATYPQRTDALILYGVFAKRKYSEDYPWGPTDFQRQEFYKLVEETWVSGDMKGFSSIVPSLADDAVFMDWLAGYFRSSASPSAALDLARMNTEADITDILHTIKVPTLLIYRTGDKDVHIEEGKYIAARITDSKFVELGGEDHLFWATDTYSVLAEIQEFVTGVRPNKVYDRILSTILFTDIVNSTKQLSIKGDEKWMQILEAHNAIVRKEVIKFNGKEIKNTGDGFLLTFDGPSRAIRCAEAIRNEVNKLNIELTTGIHIGECELYDDGDIGGITVHVAARVLSKAEPNQILITKSVKNLLGGTGLEFTDLGEFTLKGIDETYRLYAFQK